MASANLVSRFFSFEGIRTVTVVEALILDSIVHIVRQNANMVMEEDGGLVSGWHTRWALTFLRRAMNEQYC